MLKHGEINPLNVFGLRRLDYCPPHFSKVPFTNYVDVKVITDWIYENFSGRFCVIDEYQDTASGSSAMIKCAGFEELGEASMFALMLDTINTRKNST
jgi:hypothetical protein